MAILLNLVKLQDSRPVPLDYYNIITIFYINTRLARAGTVGGHTNHINVIHSVWADIRIAPTFPQFNQFSEPLQTSRSGV